MDDKEATFDAHPDIDEDEAPLRPLSLSGDGTETIDIAALLKDDAEARALFGFETIGRSSFGKLLETLPICAFLVDVSGSIVFANEACCKSSGATSCAWFLGRGFASLFRGTSEVRRADRLLRLVFEERKPVVSRGTIYLERGPIWGRMFLRSVRLGQQTFTLAVVQDVTVERKEALLNQKFRQLVDIVPIGIAEFILLQPITAETTPTDALNSALAAKLSDGNNEFAALHGQTAIDTLKGTRLSHIFGRDRRSVELVADWVHAGFGNVSKETSQIGENGETGYTENTMIGNPRIKGMMRGFWLLRRNVTERARAAEALKSSEGRFRHLFDNAPVVMFSTDEEGRFLDINRRWIEKMGYSPEEIIGQSHEFMAPNRIEEQPFFEVINQARSQGGVRDLQYQYERKDGNTRDVLLDCIVSTDPSGKEIALTVVRDVTEQRQVEKKLRMAAKIIEGSNEAVMITDVMGNIVDVNDAFCKLTGYLAEELIGQNPRIMKSGRHTPEFYQEMWRMIVERGYWHGEVWDRRKNGEIFAKLMSISAVRNEREQPTHYVAIFSDITRMKQTEERLFRMAHFDPLTNLPNRILFRDRLRQAMARADRYGGKVGLMLLDLDRFKNINDTLGHKAGDELLVAVAGRISTAIRTSDTVARLGGDEFAVIVPDLADVKAVAAVARKIVDALTGSLEIEGREVFITTSIGITLYPSDGTRVDRLLQNADMALYHAKDLGRNTYQFFSKRMNVEVQERVELEQMLREALKGDQFVLYYQPRVDFRTGRVTDVEALMRWKHPTRGLVFPGDFIPVAEETGLIGPMGEWALRAACAQNKAWQESGLATFRVAVNVSARQMLKEDLVGVVARILEETNLDPSCLELELTETLAMRDAYITISILDQLKQRGVHIAIDDFGTGYSSLSYLKKFPIDILKIDKSFVADSMTGRDAQEIIKAIIAVAHNLNLKVIAEGVETEDQLEFLKLQGCDEWQGYYLTQPVPPDEVVKYFTRA